MVGCKGIRQDLFTSQTPYEAYREKLQKAGLDQSEVGEKWINAGALVLNDAVEINLPYSEIKVFNVDDFLAAGYRLSLKEGQNLHVYVEPEREDSILLFIDLFRSRNGNYEQETSASEDSLNLTYRVRRDGDYIIRIQPELLAQGLYNIYFYSDASLNFPVPGKDYDNISSFYGDPRDGGRRRHEGVDIFAPRGTPVLAVTYGTVVRTGTNRLGGNVVWLHDRERGYNYYYAHLDSQLVGAGTKVNIGDTLGLIGNTGNAITTPPHLHFGIYSYGRSSIDPYNFFHKTRQQVIDSSLWVPYIGTWANVNTARANVRVAPGTKYAVGKTITPGTPFLVAGVSDDWLRIDFGNQSEGFIHKSLIAPINESINQYQAEANEIMREFPSGEALATGILFSGTVVEVYTELDSWLLIKSDNKFGWISKTG